MAFIDSCSGCCVGVVGGTYIGGGGCIRERNVALFLSLSSSDDSPSVGRHRHCACHPALAVVAGMGYLLAGMVDARWLIGEFCSCRFLESQLTAKVSCRWVQVALALVLLAAGINVTI